MSNIYMDYLTESKKEDLILEKEMELFLLDNDYYTESFQGIKEKIKLKKQNRND